MPLRFYFAADADADIDAASHCFYAAFRHYFGLMR